MLRHRFALLAVLLLATACARSVAVTSEPNPVYRIQVENTQTVDMVVSYDDGNGTRTLGTVRAGSRESFVISEPPTPRITVAARSSSGRTVGPITVTLTRGSTTPVRLQ